MTSFVPVSSGTSRPGVSYLSRMKKGSILSGIGVDTHASSVSSKSNACWILERARWMATSVNPVCGSMVGENGAFRDLSDF